jgi:hypothetical protein
MAEFVILHNHFASSLRISYLTNFTKKFVETSKTKILINMSTTEEALLPSIEAKKARAEKFGTSVVLTEEEKLAAREARFSKSVSFFCRFFCRFFHVFGCVFYCVCVCVYG